MNRRWTHGLAAALFALLIAQGNARGAVGAWSNAGLYGGNVLEVIHNPGNGSVYATSARFPVLRRTAGAPAWEVVSDLPDNPAEIIVDPNDGGILYAAGTQDGISISTDDGDTWTAATGGITGSPFFQSIAAAPNAPGTLYAGDVSGEVWKSVDGAANWTSLGTLPSISVRSLIVHPTDADIVFAGTFDGIFFTDDGGATWVNRSAGLTSARVRAMAFDPGDPSRVYMAEDGQGFHFATNLAAAGWTRSSPDVLFGGDGLDIVVADTSPPTVYYAAMGGVHRSTDGGSNWNQINDGLTNPETSGLAIDHTNPTRLWAAGFRSGIFHTTDGGDTWAMWSTGIENREIRALAMDPTNPQRYWAAAQDGLARTLDGGATWTVLRRDEWFLEPMRALGSSPSDPDTLYMHQNFIYVSTDGGTTIGEPNVSCNAVQDIAVHPTNPLIVYVATFNDQICKSIDGGVTWFQTSNGIPTDATGRAIALDPNDPDVLYATTLDEGLFRSDDAGASWSAINNGLASLGDLENICVDPTDGSRIYAVGRLAGYRSEDAGASWQSIIPATGFFGQDCEVDPEGNVAFGGLTDLAAGGPLPGITESTTRIFYSTDHGTTWENLGGAAPNGRVMDIRFDPFDRGHILVGLRGWGIAEYTFPSSIFSDSFETGDTSRWSQTQP